MTDFFLRLKQRKLVQWAIAYVAAAFSGVTAFQKVIVVLNNTLRTPTRFAPPKAGISVVF